MSRTRELLRILAAVTIIGGATAAWSYLWIVLAGPTFLSLVPALGIPAVVGICTAIYLDLREKSR